MDVGKLISLTGMAIELGGFAVLARELLRTNRDVLTFVSSLSSTTTTAESLVLFDGPDGMIEMTGGTLGAMSPAAKAFSEQINGGKRATLWGLALTVIGIVGQAIGTIL